MPAHFVPYKSGLHRSAARALFRAILGACQAVPLHAGTRADLQNVVRNTFRKRQYEQSRKNLAIWFQGGYEALDILDAASASDESKILTICHLVERIPAHLKSDIQQQEAPLSQNSALKAESKENVNNPLPKTQKDPILQRPRPLNALSGRRHVPRLAHAGIFYFLRVKKPQPVALSRSLNFLLKRRERRQRYIAKIDEYVRLAESEDAWDADMAEQIQAGQDRDFGKDASSWTKVLKSAVHELHVKLHEESIQSRTRAEKLLKIIEKEKMLADIEKRSEDKEAGQRGVDGNGKERRIP